MIVLCATAATSGACDPPPWGLVSWWKGEGNANDSLGANNGMLSASGASYAPGLVGQAFRFDGTNGYVQIADSPALKPTNVTVEAWVWLDPNLPATNGGEQIVFKKNTWSAWFEGYSLLKETVANPDGTSSDRFQFCVSRYGDQVAINSQTIVQRGVWYHVAATYDGNQSIL
ncbi:MAG TPA: LamG-like jellyroll fold domain-containing protein, partial [Verrucomicrobiae bacterium]|nr:LamG-like jellyroll fold domain-containing protein [Verrucomicrobiae bacterium]